MKKRLSNRTLKIRRVGVEENILEDLYHRLLRLSWIKFIALIIFIYIALNLIFATFFALAPGSVANIAAGDFFANFAFSVQTLSTIGYGFFNPQTQYAHAIVTIEAAVGMIFTALLTGLCFAKFSRVSARVVFSKNILWTHFNGQPALELRLGNVRTNRVFEGKARLALLRDEVSKEGERMRRIYDLKLLRDESPIFSLSWTLFHIIDATSPLHGVTLEQMIEKGWEVSATFNGIDQDMAHGIAASSFYPAAQIIRARKFVDMIHVEDDGVRVIDFSKLDDVEQ